LIRLHLDEQEARGRREPELGLGRLLLGGGRRRGGGLLRRLSWRRLGKNSRWQQSEGQGTGANHEGATHSISS